jgi:hypothetical protein
MVDIGAGYAALQAALGIAKGLKDINDQVKLNAAIIELQQKILEAQAATTDARQQLQEMEAQLFERKAWDATAARYVLKDFGGNTFAYELRQDHANGEPLHRLCPSCFEGRKRGILQFQFRSDNGQDRYECGSCKREFAFGSGGEYSSHRVSMDYDPWST